MEDEKKTVTVDDDGTVVVVSDGGETVTRYSPKQALLILSRDAMLLGGVANYLNASRTCIDTGNREVSDWHTRIDEFVVRSTALPAVKDVLDISAESESEQEAHAPAREHAPVRPVRPHRTV